MTVAELIAALASFPPDAVIAATSEMDGCLQSTEPSLGYALLTADGEPVVSCGPDHPEARPIVRF